MLDKYNKKRNFNNTPEPTGKMYKTSKKTRFVVQFHNATTTHYDFRLEHNGVLLSWAVPKGLSFNPKTKRLAIMVEDHPTSYINFEGVIPKGNYGAGSVEIYDSGHYIPLENFNEGLKKGHLKFILQGNILKGAWSLIKTQNNQWIITKINDEYAGMEPKEKNKLVNPFKSFNVQLATLTNKIPKGKNWIFEIKYDGYRIVAFAQNKKAHLISRGKKDYSATFSTITESVVKMAGDVPMILDGEVVCFDSSGKSSFGLLQNNIKKGLGGFCFVVFDILAYAGKDLRKFPLKTRKEYLQKVLEGCPQNIILSSYVLSSGTKCFNFAKKLNLEGIVAKNLNSQYSENRNDDWLKIKCYKMQEFVVLGYTTSQKNKYLSAILVGYYKNNNLIYAGKVGTGFSNEQRQELNKLFKSIIIDSCPACNMPKLKNVFYLNPIIVAQIKYTEITADKLLRQPSFVGLREDKPAQKVVLEENNE